MAKFSFNTKNRLQFYVSDELGEKLHNISCETFLNYTQILNKILLKEMNKFDIEEYKSIINQVKDKAEDKVRIHGFVRDDLYEKFMAICKEHNIAKSKLIRYFIIKVVNNKDFEF